VTKEGQRQIGAAALMHVLERGLSEALTFSLHDLKEKAVAVGAERLDAMLAEFSLPVGSLPPASYTGLFDESPLVERPYLSFDRRYMLVVPGMATRDTMSLLEPRFLAHMRGYPDSRAKTLDRLATRYLTRLLPGAAHATNVFYEIGDGERAEVDGILIFDSIALVVEGKAGRLSVQAQRGDLRRLTTELSESVQEAWTQGARVREAILAPTGDSIFTDAQGSEVLRVPAGTIDRVFIINPTLHELGGHAPQLGRLKGLGLFPSNEYPWSVFINDLRVIAETSDNAAIFLHYLIWRSRLDLGGRVAVQDEIDIWASYLLNERFPSLATDGSRLIIGNASTDFDTYYAGVVGHGPKRRKPGMFLRDPVKSFVSRMATNRPEGWLDAAGACLDLSLPELAAVCATAKRISKHAAQTEAVVRGNYGRVRVVGVPDGVTIPQAKDAAEDSAIVEEMLPEPSAAVAVYCRLSGKRHAQILWAEYLAPPVFGTSALEERAFTAPETSPFR
jgi:hypothetical protein